MIFTEERINKYKEEKNNRDNGRLNGIPLYYIFPKLGSIIKTIPKGYPILLTANSGIN